MKLKLPETVTIVFDDGLDVLFIPRQKHLERSIVLIRRHFDFTHEFVADLTGVLFLLLIPTSPADVVRVVVEKVPR